MPSFIISIVSRWVLFRRKRERMTKRERERERGIERANRIDKLKALFLQSHRSNLSTKRRKNISWRYFFFLFSKDFPIPNKLYERKSIYANKNVSIESVVCIILSEAIFTYDDKLSYCLFVIDERRILDSICFHCNGLLLIHIFGDFFSNRKKILMKETEISSVWWKGDS